MTSDHVHDLCKAASENGSTYVYAKVPDGIEETKRYIDRALTAYSKSSASALPFAVRHIETDRIIGSTRIHDLEVFSWPSGIAPVTAPTVKPADSC
nr:hypothetical protein [Bacillus nakamurai]